MKKLVALAIGVCLLSAALAWADDPVQIDPYSLSGRRYKIALNRVTPKALACYNEALQQQQDLAGQLKVKVTINPDGAAASVEVLEDTLQHKQVTGCIVDLLKKKTWPKADKQVYFEYAFSFAPVQE